MRLPVGSRRERRAACLLSHAGRNVYEHGSTVLNLQLSVPTSVGNELADANKAIRWEITAEDDGEKIPVQPAGSKKPGLLGLAATGDNTLALLLVLLALAIIAFIAALLLSRRNKR